MGRGTRRRLGKVRDRLLKATYQNTRGKSMQELLAKARAKLSSLQMQDIYNAMERNGDVIGVAYCYKKVVVTYKNKSKHVFQVWE